MSKSTTWTVKDPVYVHHFSQPFKAMDEQVDELPIRKPNGLDMIEVGTPVLYDSYTGKAELDIPKCYAMISRLSNMPEKILLSIDPGEMLDFFWMAASFFMMGRQDSLAGPRETEGRAARTSRLARTLARKFYPGQPLTWFLSLPEDALIRLWNDTIDDVKREHE